MEGSAEVTEAAELKVSQERGGPQEHVVSAKHGVSANHGAAQRQSAPAGAPDLLYGEAETELRAAVRALLVEFLVLVLELVALLLGFGLRRVGIREFPGN